MYLTPLSISIRYTLLDLQQAQLQYEQIWVHGYILMENPTLVHCHKPKPTISHTSTLPISMQQT